MDGHQTQGAQRDREATRLKFALTLILLFMTAEIVVALLASSLALLSDAAHMLTDAAALAMALVAARLAARPAKGVMTFGLGRAEILSAQTSGMTLLVLALLIVYGAIRHLISPLHVDGGAVLVVAIVGIGVNAVLARVLGDAHAGHAHDHSDAAHDHDEVAHGLAEAEHSHGGDVHGSAHRAARSLNVEGSYQHILTDLIGFIATAAAAVVILTTGFRRADAIASLVIAAVMLYSAYGLLRASMRVMMEAAPEGIDPELIGLALAREPGVAEVHDLHVWEVTSGFPAVSAHIVVDAGHDCHEIRRELTRRLTDEFGLKHSTLQVEHARGPQSPLQIEVKAAEHSTGR